jgi:peptide deformylase
MPKQPLAQSISLHTNVANVAPSGTYRRVPFRRVLTRPDPLLARRAREIDPRAPGVLELAESLVTTMRASPACVGLAATQIGEAVRIFCLDVTGHRKTRSCAGLVIMVNPRIVESRGTIVMREGCMSVPDLTGDVARAAEVVVEGFEPGTSRIIRVSANAMEARCFQHEIDHLDGLVFVDRVADRGKALFVRKTYA